MVEINSNINKETELILEKIDSDMPLTEQEKRFYYGHVHGIKDETTVNFILNGCDIPHSEKPADPNIGYII